MTVTRNSAVTPAEEAGRSSSCPQGAASAPGNRPRANPGHFGGIAILPLFLDEPELVGRRSRLAVRAQRMV